MSTSRLNMLHLFLCIASSLAYLPSPLLLPRRFGNHEQNQRRLGRQHLAALNAGDAMDAAGDLTGALARIDKAWNIQQQSQPRSRWTRLTLADEQERDSNEDTKNNQNSEEEFVYLLEPPSFTNPSCLVVFIGGAGLGTFPQVAYQEFLTRISDRMNAAIITAPYAIGLDHFQLAKQVGERGRKAILKCEEDPERLYSPNLPVYCLTHSLGGKLASIYAAATGQDYDGIGFVSFNNFGFGSTIGMAKEFAQSIQQEYGAKQGVERPSDTLNGIFDVAQTLLGNIGLEFTPSPEDTERLISLKFDEARIAKTRLFVLDEDNLDDSASFLQACASGSATPKMSALPGNHLTPVYFKLDLKDLPQEAREMARESLGGFESASFGNNEDLESLVDEVCNFLLGKEPSRRPSQPLLSSSSLDSGSEETN